MFLGKFFCKLVFGLISLCSLFDPSVIPVQQVHAVPVFETYFAELKQTQKAHFENALARAAGTDQKLGLLEWQFYLWMHPELEKGPLASIVSTILRAGSPSPLGVNHVLGYTSYNLKALLNSDKAASYDVIVYGNEVPAVAAAVMAARALGPKGKVVLLRPEDWNVPLGGLVTQGGLAYLDRNQINAYLPPSSEFYREFLNRAKVQQVALDPGLANLALRNMLNEAGVKVVSGAKITPNVVERRIQSVTLESNGEQWQASSYIDGTQNADLARAAGLKYSVGFENLGFPKSTLPVSPVLRVTGISPKELQKLEEEILKNPIVIQKIKEKIKAELEPRYADWLLLGLEKPMYLGVDYIDVRSIALGAAYHLHQNIPYDLKKGFLFDRPNIAILKDGSSSWNAFLYKVSSDQVLEMLQTGSKPNETMLTEIKAFETWLRSFPQGKNAKVIPPKELYIRHSINISEVVDPLTGQEIVRGGTLPANSVGTFCYFFDVRGGIDGLSGKMPKPVFNFGIEHSLSKIQNLAVVGRAAGYYGLAPAVGRILELNASVGAYVGAAAAIAARDKVNLNSVTSAQARTQVEKMTGLKVILQGKDLSKTADLRGIV